MSLPLTRNGSVTQFDRSNYRDPVLSAFSSSSNSNEISTSDILNITDNFQSNKHSKIKSQCHKALKVYKKLLELQYQLNSWEFLTLKTSIDLNFGDDEILTSNNNNTSKSNGARKFDIKIATSCIEKCTKLDKQLDEITHSIDILKKFISLMDIDEYISDPGCLILKIYFKILHLKNSITENLSIYYTKSKLLIILYELTTILIQLDNEFNPLVKDETDYQSTLTSYKNFINVLIKQLDTAIEEKDSEQIEECLNILNDVEKMYESVRINFEFLQEDLWDYNSGADTSYNALTYEEEDEMIRNVPLSSSSTSRSRRTSISSTTSSLLRHSSIMGGKSTLKEEMPYLLQAFDEAKHLEQELAEYQTRTPSPPPPPLSSSSILSKTSRAFVNPQPNAATPVQPTKSHLTAGFTGNSIGFSNALLNNIYGLHPHNSPATPKNHKASFLATHNEVD